MTRPDVVVVGSGPNGLAAAVTLARAGLGVLVLEAQPTVGGGARTLDLGLADGIVHDVCSAVHPMAWASPFFRAFDLPGRGVELLVPEASYAQPLPDGRAGIAYRDLDRTVAALGVDGPAWRSLVGSLSADVAVQVALGDKRSVPRVDPRAAARFGLGVLEQGTRAWDRRFVDDVAPALLTGVAAHAIGPLPSFAAAGTALLLATLGHGDGGWPIPRGGSGAITAALVADLEAHGGTVRTDHRVRRYEDLPLAHCYVFDTTPRALVQVLGDRLPPRTRTALEGFRYGDAAAKVDFVLDGPVPWTAPDVALAGTVHVGGTRAEMARAEGAVARGEHAELPMTLVSDPTVVDASREAAGRRPLWTYAHVPKGSDVDVTEAVTRHIERYAPGFRDVVVTSRCTPAAHLSDHDENYVDGDISAGAASIRQLFARPTPRLDPYFSGRSGVYLCSASTPPGPGVHGLGGWFAAKRVLREFGIASMPELGEAVMFRAPQVILFSPDVPRASAFYQRLGFVETFRVPTDGEPIHVDLELDGYTLGIASEASTRDDHGLDPIGSGQRAAVVLWTDDVPTAFARLVADGAPALVAPHEWLDRLLIAWVADPDGNPVQVVQHLSRSDRGPASRRPSR